MTWKKQINNREVEFYCDDNAGKSEFYTIGWKDNSGRGLFMKLSKLLTKVEIENHLKDQI